MTSRQDEVRIVQVDPDGNVVYQGASEREATVRLFDTSLRPLSSTAEKLLKIIAEDQRRTPGPGTTAARPTSGWWNGQPVDQGRSAYPRSPNFTSTPLKQQDHTITEPSRPTKMTVADDQFRGAQGFQRQRDEFATTTRLGHGTYTSEAINQNRVGAGSRALSDPPSPPCRKEEHHAPSTLKLQNRHQQPLLNEVHSASHLTRASSNLQPLSAWLSQSSWVGCQQGSNSEGKQSSPKFDETPDEEDQRLPMADQSLRDQLAVASPIEQENESMMLDNFSPPSNMLSQFVSQNLEEEKSNMSRSQGQTFTADNLASLPGGPRPVQHVQHVQLPVPRRKPTFSAPFKVGTGSRPLQ